MKTVEEMYIDSAKRLRASLPKFVIFIGVAYLIWIIGTTFIIPFNEGNFIGTIEAIRLDSITILAAVLLLLIGSFVEIKNVADAAAGIIVSYVLPRNSEVEEVRLRQFKRCFSSVGYIIPFTISFLIFNDLLNQINPLLNVIIPVIIAVWIVLAAVILAMIMGLEIEESARIFAEKIEKRLLKKPKK
jgi:hypothetical protein